MLWATVISSAIGVLLGSWLRWPGVLVASGMAVATCIIVLPLFGWSLLGAVLFGFGLSWALQFGYFAGLILSSARARASSCEVRREKRGEQKAAETDHTEAASRGAGSAD